MSEWKECKLGSELELLYGKALKESERKEGSYPVYGSNGIVGYHSEFLVRAPGIIIGRKGSVGEIKFSNKDFFPIDTTYYINLKNDNDIKFFYYFLLTLHLNEMNSHSAVPGLNRNDVYGIDILLPPLPEQKAIAGVLSSLDDKIDLLHRQNKTLEAMAEVLFRQWFVEEMDWDGTLSEYVKVQGGYAFKSSDFKEAGSNGIIKITNISMGSIDIDRTQFVDDVIVNNLDRIKFKINTGDFLIAMTGAEIGKIGIVEKTKKSIWVNQRVGRLIPMVPYGEYIGYLALKSPEGQDHIINACSGSAQENISSSKLEEMRFFPYSTEKTESFGEEVRILFEKIVFNQSQIRTIEKLRDTLLPKLMSGEVRVKV